MKVLTQSHVDAKSHRLLLLTVLAAVLYLAGGLGMAYVAGLGEIWHAVKHPSWPWLAASFAGVTLAFVGYYFGYQGSARSRAARTTSPMPTDSQSWPPASEASSPTAVPGSTAR